MKGRLYIRFPIHKICKIPAEKYILNQLTFRFFFGFAGSNKHGVNSSGTCSCYFQKTDPEYFQTIKIANQCASPDTATFLYKLYILITGLIQKIREFFGSYIPV